MSNSNTAENHRGKIGEMLVQIRLLQFGVEAAPPLTDSGNDLVAVRKRSFASIQVKTISEAPFELYELPDLYRFVAVVHLVRGGNQIANLDASNVYLIPNWAIAERRYWTIEDAHQFLLSAELLDRSGFDPVAEREPWDLIRRP